MFDLLERVAKWLFQLILWLRPPIHVEVLYFRFQEFRSNSDSSLIVRTTSPRRYHAKLALTNRSDRVVFIKATSVTIDEEKNYPQENGDGNGIRFDPHELKTCTLIFPVNEDDHPREAGQFCVEIVPTKGRSTTACGTFPLEN